MNENMLRIQVTIQQIKRVAEAFESLSDEVLQKNPKLFAVMAEAPLDDLGRMLTEVEQRLAELKQVATASAS
jgi:hypothetical protein